MPILQPGVENLNKPPKKSQHICRMLYVRLSDLYDTNFGLRKSLKWTVEFLLFPSSALSGTSPHLGVGLVECFPLVLSQAARFSLSMAILKALSVTSLIWKSILVWKNQTQPIPAQYCWKPCFFPPCCFQLLAVTQGLRKPDKDMLADPYSCFQYMF